MNTGRERAVVALLLDEGPELSSLRLKRLFDSLVERTRIKIYSGDRLRVINSDRFESQILPLPCKREGGIFVNLWFSLIAPLVLLRAARKEASGFLVFSAWSSLLALPAAFFARKPLIVARELRVYATFYRITPDLCPTQSCQNFTKNRLATLVS